MEGDRHLRLRGWYLALQQLTRATLSEFLSCSHHKTSLWTGMALLFQMPAFYENLKPSDISMSWFEICYNGVENVICAHPCTARWLSLYQTFIYFCRKKQHSCTFLGCRNDPWVLNSYKYLDFTCYSHSDHDTEETTQTSLLLYAIVFYHWRKKQNYK